MTTRTWLHPEKTERTQARANDEMALLGEIGLLKESAIARQLVWRLLASAKVVDGPLANSTATTQAGIVAVHDFVKEQLWEPIWDRCPELLLRMKAENGRSTAERATNTN